ncbi:MAG: ROK family protein [Sphingobacteriaceae bacterium]
MNDSITLGIDIGGSHITAALIDLKTCEILPDSYLRRRLNSHEPAEQIIGLWSDVIDSVYRSAPGLNKKIGIAMPGPFNYEKGICLIKGQDKYDALYGMNVKELLAQKLKISEANIRFMNDACCFLKGEVLGGAARGFRHAIGLTLGTGLGSASYHEGVTLDADLWHHPFKDSIVEDYISSRWFVNYYQSISGIRLENVKELAKSATFPQVQEVFNLFGKNIGIFLTEFIRMEHPEVVVMGGNISQAVPLFITETQKVLNSHSANVILRAAMLGEKAALIGAAGTWNDIVEARPSLT